LPILWSRGTGSELMQRIAVPMLRGDLEAVSGEIHIRPAADATCGPMTAVF